MDTARRLYVYTAAMTGLLLTAIGITRLLSVAIAEVLAMAGVGGTVLSGTPATGSDVSLAIALVVIGLPVWGLHWRFAQRMQTRDGMQGDAERSSAIRATYLALISFVAFVIAVAASVTVVGGLLGQIAGDRIASPTEGGDSLAITLVALTAWLFHVRVRSTDLRRARLEGAAAWLPRLVRYLCAGIALTLAAAGAAAALTAPLDLVLGVRVVHAPESWLARALSGPLAWLFVGMVAWAVPWREADGLIRDRASVGQDERASRLRAAYFGSVLLAVAATIAGGLALAFAGAQETLAGIAGTRGPAEPLLVMLPALLAGWLHQRRAVGEGMALGPIVGDDVVRRSLLLVALIGLGCLSVGTIRLGALLLEGSAGLGDLLFVSRDTEAGRDVLLMVALAVSGALLWLPAWWRTLRRRAAAPLAEAGATATAGYLFAVVIVATVAATAAAAFILYQAIDALLVSGHAWELLEGEALSLATLVIAGLVAAYHGHLVRGDRRRLREAEEAAAPTIAAGLPGFVEVSLVMRVPAATDTATALAALRAALPDGGSLERTPGPTTRPPAQAAGVAPTGLGTAWIP